MQQYHVLIDTQDQKGLVYKIANTFWQQDLNMISNSEFVDPERNKFFMRSVIEGDIDINLLKHALCNELPNKTTVQVIPQQKKNIILMVTKEAHVLGDLLIRYQSAELNANILAVVSNYDHLQSLVAKFDIPFFTVPHHDLSRAAHESKIIDLLTQFPDLDYIVLAKYMRILTPDIVSRYPDKIINIHHSFLPAFIGANPYKQAYHRGVKIIGATAHFVNNDLDEGPIIAQEVQHIDHAYHWRDLRRTGRDVEKIVLSRALNLALEDRIFVSDNRTVIF